VERSCAVLIVYTALLAARFYFNIDLALFAHHVDTLFPVLVFSLVFLIPRVAERWGAVEVLRSRARIMATAILVVYAVSGFTLNVVGFSQPCLELTTPRGTARIYAPHQEPNQTHVAMLRYILAHTEPEEPIAILGSSVGLAGHYFLSGRRNLLRQEAIRSWMGASPADVNETVQRLETHRPRLIVVFGRLDKVGTLVVRPQVESYEDMAPVWQYVRDHYQLRVVIGEGLCYAVYELGAHSS